MIGVRFATVALALLAVAGNGGCGPRRSGDPRSNLALAQALEVVVPAGSQTALLRFAARELERERGIRCVFLTPDAPGDPELPRVLVAGVEDRELWHLFARLGIEGEGEEGFVFAERRYSKPGDALVATLPDPDRPGLPMTLCLTPAPRSGNGFLLGLTPAWRDGVRCWRDGEIEREGALRADGTVEWSAASLRSIARPPRAIERFAEGEIEVLFRDPHADAGASADRWVAAARAARASVAQLLLPGVAAPATPLRIVVHAEAELFAFRTGRWASASVGPGPIDVNVLAASDASSEFEFAVARAYALEVAGLPAHEWLLDAVAARAATSWRGRPMRGWQSRVAAAEIARGVEDVVGTDPRVSPHVRVPLRAALLDALEKTRGKAAILEIWRGRAALDPADLAALFEKLAQQAARDRGTLPTTRRDAALAAAARGGAHLVEPARDERDFAGLGTAACAESLDALRALGADAVAIAPYAYVRADAPAWSGDSPQRPFASSVSDAALASAIAQAHQRNLRVMLAPQLLDSPSASWAAWSRVQSEGDYERMWRDLRANLLHAALVAELANVEVLCLGSELAPATRCSIEAADLRWTPEYMRHNRERWTELVRALRAAYSGALTYSAGSAAEARAIEFWPELDFVGLQIYRPLDHDGARPDDAGASQRLRGSLEQGFEIARANGKRLLVTEIGFAPTSEAWRSTERAIGAPDPAEQARLWRAFGGALQRLGSARGDLAGVFAWCWSTGGAPPDPASRSFALAVPDAREALREALAASR